MSQFVEVLLDERLDKPLDYRVPEGLSIAFGMRVIVPLRGKEVKGCVVQVKKETSALNPLPVIKSLHEEPLFDEELFSLFEFVSYYYCTPLHKVVRMMIPKGVKENTSTRKDNSFRLEDTPFFKVKPKVLTDEQEKVIEALKKDIRQGVFSANLLHGVTGSGKTEVYIQLIEEAISLGKSILFLVPEVALTTQIVERLRARLSLPLSVLHHRLSDGERNRGWRALFQGEMKIVVGARSAIFSPLKNIGLIIVDEEHEQAYKQSEESPCYNARDLALFRGKQTGAVVLLGSATPSLESYSKAQEGKYRLYNLTKRATQRPLPQIKIVDMVRENEKQGGGAILSEPLIQGIKEKLDQGEQVLLFLNRRGHHTSLFCSNCQSPIPCPHCSVSLTFHKGESELKCHTCGFTTAPLSVCPSCKSPLLKYRGVGTERVESIVHALFPEARVIRMDRDTTKKKGEHEKLLKAFSSGKGDILLGTQMVAKGLNFPLVTLVGIINADQHLLSYDFRSGELTFQTLTQVAGRAGRCDLPGFVYLQTYVKDHPILKHIVSHSYLPFYEEEKKGRELLKFPPIGRLAQVIVRGKEESSVQETISQIRTACVSRFPPYLILFPVVPSGKSRIRDEYYYQFLIKGPHLRPLQDWVKEGGLNPFQRKKGIYVKIDVDPLQLI